MRGRGLIAAGLVLCGVAAGCAPVEVVAPSHYEPVHVATIDPETSLKRVTFTEESASRADLRTAPVVQSGDVLEVPSAAVIYEDAGTALVYVAIDPLTYQRVEVLVEGDDGLTARLSGGPEPGTQVVTTGANQVWGAELGVGH